VAPLLTVRTQAASIALSVTLAAIAVRLTGSELGPTLFLRGAKMLVPSSSRNDWPAVRVTREALTTPTITRNPRRLGAGAGFGVASIQLTIRPVTPAYGWVSITGLSGPLRLVET